MAGDPAGGGAPVGSSGSLVEPQAGIDVVVVVALVVDRLLVRLARAWPRAGEAEPAPAPHPAVRLPATTSPQTTAPNSLRREVEARWMPGPTRPNWPASPVVMCCVWLLVCMVCPYGVGAGAVVKMARSRVTVSVEDRSVPGPPPLTVTALMSVRRDVE